MPIDIKGHYGPGDWIEAEWTDGKRTVSGKYRYYWPSGCFYMHLDKAVGAGGERRTRFASFDVCSFGKYRLKEDE